MVTAAPLASHFSCWRRSPEERRQLSTWRQMKPSDKIRITIRIECSVIPNQPDGVVDRGEPADGIDTQGMGAESIGQGHGHARSAARCTARRRPSSPERQNRDVSLPSGKSRITATNRTRPGIHN